MSKPYWENDKWDDHVTSFGAAPIMPIPVHLAGVNWQPAAGNQPSGFTVAPPPAPPRPENILQKFLHFLAHPIKTIEAHKAAHNSQSTMHGVPSSTMHGSSDWWAPKVDSLEWDR